MEKIQLNERFSLRHKRISLVSSKSRGQLHLGNFSRLVNYGVPSISPQFALQFMYKNPLFFELSEKSCGYSRQVTFRQKD